MRISAVKEIKDNENRVGLTPEGVGALAEKGLEVLLEDSAGANSGFTNEDYESKGASIVSAREAWNSDIVIKVKEPLKQEYKFLKDQILFTYLHLAGVDRGLTEALLDGRTSGIAYETVRGKDGDLPLLAPMSAVAGNMAASMGAYYLSRFNGGKGVQLGEVAGSRHGKVLVIGDGVVGANAAKTVSGMGADVYLFGIKEDAMNRIREHGVTCLTSTPENIAEQMQDADLVIGGVLLRGAKAPYVVTEEMVEKMQAGSVIVDVSIDQGGCVETSKPTTFADPVFIKHEVIHYCVTNMPAAFPRTSTRALTEATLPYILRLGEKGLDALKEDRLFAEGLNTFKGNITLMPVAEALGMQDRYKSFQNLQGKE